MLPSHKGRRLSVNEKTRGAVCWIARDGAYWRLRWAKGLTEAHGTSPWRVAKERAVGQVATTNLAQESCP